SPLGFSFRCRSSSNSSRGTCTSRRASDLNRSIGVRWPALAASLASDLSCSRRRRMLYQFLVRQPFSSDRRTHLPKPLAIVALSLVEPEGLFVQVPAQVRRINADV